MATSDKDGQVELGETERPAKANWYIPDSQLRSSTSLLTPESRTLFESYARLAPADVLPHIARVRSAAWAVHPYPCIGELRFLDFSISRLPSYDSIIAKLSSSAPTDTTTTTKPSLPPALLDIGCCVGQDLRRLAFSGVPSSRLAGLELEPAFVELGYELFRDRNTFQAQFTIGDALADDALYAPLAGRFDVVHAASFFHLFNWDNQVKVAIRIVGLLKEGQTGTMVVGRQVGSTMPGEMAGRATGVGDATKFRHDPATLQRLWDEVGETTASKWSVSATMADVPGKTDGHVKFLTFEVTRTG